ncbi:hypothetical protein EYY60_20495 [Flavobacterium zhairuonense]|uniref:hypothetical protein n=1 Tax=Flavobacterium zhairuonense TaxID=2493631 RepID=UPI0010472C8F|nr:hypothetical protein [Flavobacterium zhairuonense]KAF2506896.1 hypothetical protein EYY60_20495 [Flavobacterium zhairuonense]
MKKQVKKFDAAKFEVLQTKGEVLKGGFSAALTTTAVTGGTIAPANNCYGGNCARGCGAE